MELLLKKAQGQPGTMGVPHKVLGQCPRCPWGILLCWCLQRLWRDKATAPHAPPRKKVIHTSPPQIGKNFPALGFQPTQAATVGLHNKGHVSPLIQKIIKNGITPPPTSYFLINAHAHPQIQQPILAVLEPHTWQCPRPPRHLKRSPPGPWAMKGENHTLFSPTGEFPCVPPPPPGQYFR